MKTKLITLAAAAAMIACQPATQDAAPAKARGVDAEKKVLTIGALNDESGPAAAIGKPYALGKRILVDSINAGGSGILPEGWKVELVEKDHGYNPQKSVQAYNEIKDKVLFIGTSFGTPNTLPLRPMLERDNLVAFPASLSSKMAEHKFTPPLGTAYSLEAMAAMDWIVKAAGGADKVKAGIIYQQDDYGQDGLDGFSKAAGMHKVEIVAKQTVAPGQKDFAAVVTALKDAGATHVLLTTLPSATGPIMGTAAQLKYMPTWVGNTPSWVDAFFLPKVIPSAVFAKFHYVTSMPFWGEDSPGMKKFLAAYEAHGKDKNPPDFYIMLSYIQGITQMNAARKMIESGNISEAGFVEAMASIKGWTADGMIQPIDLSAFPYVTGTNVRVVKPNFEKKSWDTVTDFATPSAYGATAAKAGDETAAKEEKL